MPSSLEVASPVNKHASLSAQHSDNTWQRSSCVRSSQSPHPFVNRPIPGYSTTLNTCLVASLPKWRTPPFATPSCPWPTLVPDFFLLACGQLTKIFRPAILQAIAHAPFLFSRLFVDPRAAARRLGGPVPLLILESFGTKLGTSPITKNLKHFPRILTLWPLPLHPHHSPHSNDSLYRRHFYHQHSIHCPHKDPSAHHHHLPRNAYLNLSLLTARLPLLRM